MRRNYKRKALISAMLTGGLAAIAFNSDIYVGSHCGPKFGTDLGAIYPILFVSGAVFAFFWVWPAALAGLFIAEAVEQRIEVFNGWLVWLLTGALSGGPLLLIYSFPLGLGQDLLLILFINGVACGLVCAGLLRGLLGPNVIHAPVTTDEEGAQHLA